MLWLDSEFRSIKPCERILFFTILGALDESIGQTENTFNVYFYIYLPRAREVVYVRVARAGG